MTAGAQQWVCWCTTTCVRTCGQSATAVQGALQRMAALRQEGACRACRCIVHVGVFLGGMFWCLLNCMRSCEYDALQMEL
jgi:hypothetical protein